MLKFFNKKTATVVIIAAVLFLIVPKTTRAMPVEDVIVEFNTGLLVGTAGVTSGATSAMTVQDYLEWAFKLAGEILKRQLLNMIVDQIVTWIQGGGDPKFITDWPGFFRDAVDQAGGKFLQTAIGPQICSPFQPLLRAGFIPIPTFTERTSCTLSSIGVNIDVFLKDFRQGNWVAWNEMVLKPQNNVYGAYILAWDQYEIEKSAATKSAAAEAQAGKGFLSVKQCVEWNTQGEKDCIASGLGAGECHRAACIKEITITPGAVVGDMASKAVGSDIDWLVNAEDFKAYIAAIANAVLNRVFAEGVGLLHTAISSDSGSGSGGSTAQAQCVQLLGTTAYNDCINAMQTGGNVREFQKDYLLSSIAQELPYQNQLLGAKQATLIILNQSIDILKQLDNCQGIAPLELAQVQGVASTTASQITQIQSDIIALQIKQQEIKSITDITQISSIWAQVSKVIHPAATQSLALSAQQETSQKQQEMSLYSQQLSTCKALKP